MTYHVVLTKEPGAARWGIHFGDADKECATQELADAKYGQEHLPRKDRAAFRMITVKTAAQRDIDAAVAKINAEAPRG
jgi:hypothetical protein